MHNKLLIVDDEPSIVNAISAAFKREGYIVDKAYDGEEALKKILAFQPDIMIIDVMMPKLNGFDVCKKIRNPQNIGIIFLTAKNDIVDRILGLELGADDYITKPFDIRELIARVKSLIRRILEKGTSDIARDTIIVGDLVVVSSKRKVTLANTLLDLTPKEFDILSILLKNPEKVYTREDLLDKLWGMDYLGGTRTVDIHIQRLRKKLGPDLQDIIQSIYGVGYKFVGEIHE